MKKPYEKPAICVVQLRYHTCLLDASPLESLFDDDINYDDWDNDGGQ